MESDFIGYTVLVTLKSPPNARVRGSVASVVGQRLTLKDVTLLWTGQQFPVYTIDAPSILDLEVSSTTPSTSSMTAPSHGISRNAIPASLHDPAIVAASDAAPAAPADPAILSYSKPPQLAQPRPQAVVNPKLETAAAIHSIEPTTPTPKTAERNGSDRIAELEDSLNHARLKDNEDVGGSASQEEKDLAGVEGDVDRTEKGRTRRNKKNRQGRGSGDNDQTFNGNGWRHTPFVETIKPRIHTGNPAEDQYVPRSTGRSRRSGRKSYAEDPNGWATEDATDIQEMGDFDFEGNLSKFDKRRVFDEIRRGDKTAEADRLVSFNRRARPGTNGGKNLHWSENVLDTTPPKWNSEAGETDPETCEEATCRSHTSRDRTRSLKSTSTVGHSALPNQPPGTLKLTTTNRTCPTVSPLQMLEVEQLAMTEYGLTEDMMVENAGRGIAEAAVTQLQDDATTATVVILTSNHRTGARAISAARHLRNRGHRVNVCLLGIEHDAELLESCRKQLEIFRKIGGQVLKWEELAAQFPTSDLTVDLIIDALFGIHFSFDDLRTDSQASAFEMISWVNRSNADVISVDIPSGLSAFTGDAGSIQGSHPWVKPKSVVCLGAPKTGVMLAFASGVASSWQLSVADVGVSQVVWRKYGTRRCNGVDFGNRWVVPLMYQPAAS
ncbi:hypothetical protein VTN49DRAFT_269 [Thermomyces lanuginosus]|uniref:uncharacterized protein n=1 Tax=Thermomyces lanuginosus TaxID=5541 RepID=UPI00374264E0